MSSIVRRIEKQVGVPNLVEILAERIELADLQSLLLEVYRRRAEHRPVAKLISDYRSNRFSRPSPCDPGLLAEWDRIALSQLPEDFRAVELSPVCPLGTVSCVAPISQDWILSAVRNVEVVADTTNALALECALRRQELVKSAPTKTTPVNLISSQRVLRTQRYGDSNARAHFRLFSMCSAGRDTGALQFEVEALSKHIRFYARSLREFLGPKVHLSVALTDFMSESPRAESVVMLADSLKNELENVNVRMDMTRTEGKGYYRRLCFHIYGVSRNGLEVELVDGGDVDWTEKLLGNAKERLVISGIGTERLCESFAPIEPLQT